VETIDREFKFSLHFVHKFEFNRICPIVTKRYQTPSITIIHFDHLGDISLLEGAGRHALLRRLFRQQVKKRVEDCLLDSLVVLLCWQVHSEYKIEIVVRDVAGVRSKNGARARAVQSDLSDLDSILFQLGLHQGD